jgi:hypothetical protein
MTMLVVAKTRVSPRELTSETKKISASARSEAAAKTVRLSRVTCCDSSLLTTESATRSKPANPADALVLAA